MPELPEVETICRGLASNVALKTIIWVETRRSGLRIAFPPKFAEQLTGRTIISVKRRAKYILIALDNDLTIISHLGMSGRFDLGEYPLPSPAKHDHLRMIFLDQSWLVYNDPRRFGLVALCHSQNVDDHPLLKDLGIEPLSTDLCPHWLADKLRKKTSSIKAILLDQRIIVGLGNIYICEALFHSHISPEQPANSLTMPEIEKLVAVIPKVLSAAIAAGGSSLKDYKKPSGEWGSFQNDWQVYGRAGRDCPRCHKVKIARIIQSGRSSFYCPNCQILRR